MAAVMHDGAVVMLTVAELRAFGERCSQEGAERALASAGACQVEERRLLSRLELAEVLGVSVASIDRLGKDGLPCVRVGSHRRFDLGDVRAWLNQRDEAGE